jgi:hypothetical protein
MPTSETKVEWNNVEGYQRNVLTNIERSNVEWHNVEVTQRRSDPT